MNLVGKSTAEQCRTLGWIVGDTIEGREECGDDWTDSQLTILFIGQKSVVFFERSRSSMSPDWVDYGETADWILEFREWAKVESTPAPQDSTGAAAVDPAYRWRPVGADTPRGVKLQLIVRGDGVAHHDQYQPGGGGWTVNQIDSSGPTEFSFLVDLNNDGIAADPRGPR